MFNNRMLAVAAVLVMAVPALGAATPIVVPPVPEQLVEGHTVFTVIEIRENSVCPDCPYNATNESRFAAAVAVLVREYDAGVDNDDDSNDARRFPGVLWFNDQYLVNPEQSAGEDDIGAPGSAGFRYPCGGAVLAVNSGDPDPRIAMTRLQTPAGQVAGAPNVGEGDLDTTNYTYSGWDSPADGTYHYGQSASMADPATDYAWIGGDVTDPTTLYFDTVNPTGGDYEESYLVTDPNDHSWVVDKYNFYTRSSIGDLTTTTTIYNYPVWVVNILGSPAFIPDGGNSFENCAPFHDLLETVVDPLNDATCGVAAPNPFGSGNDDEASLSARNPGAPIEDDPCMGYAEPSANNFCYGGQAAADADGDTDIDADDCLAERDTKPLRLYNALLYFKLEDLTIAGAARDHSDPVASTDTNGCSDEQIWWGTQDTEYTCPVDNDDDMEGNSHSFHPSAPTHDHAEACDPAFAGPNPTNHGGSTYITPADRTADDDGWYNTYTQCDYLHATRNIDIYFSGAGRPFTPVVRSFDVLDLEGSSAPFQDYHAAYP